MDFENFEFLGFGDFGIVGFVGSVFRVFRILRLWNFGSFWILRSLDFGILGILGCWDFWDSPWTPPFQEWVSLTSIITQEAASSTPRQGIDFFFAVCALERPRKILATDPGGTIYLTGNLDETSKGKNSPKSNATQVMPPQKRQPERTSVIRVTLRTFCNWAAVVLEYCARVEM